MDQGQPPEDAESLEGYRSVKCSVKSVVRNPETQQIILEVVAKSNCIVVHTMQFLKLYFLVLFEAGAKLPKITEKLILCIMIVLCEEDDAEQQGGEEKPAKRGRQAKDATQKLKDTLRTFYRKHYRATMAQPGERLGFPYMAQLLKYEAKTIVTACETNIKLHFAQYLERFLNALYEKKAVLAEKDEQSRKQLFVDLRAARDYVLFRGKAYKEQAKLAGQVAARAPPPKLVDHIARIRPQRPLKEGNVAYDIQASPQAYLPCMLYMMRFLEAREESIYNVFPQRTSIIPKFVRFDTTLVIQLLLPLDSALGSRKSLLADVSGNKHAVWQSLFKLDKKCFTGGKNSTFEFDYQIQTDGLACSVLWIDKRVAAEKAQALVQKRERASLPDELKCASPKPSASTMPAKKKKTDTPYVTRSDSPKAVIGLDPGKSDLIYCSGGVDERGTDERGTDKPAWFRYTQNQRRHETGTKKHQRRRKKMAAELVDGKTVTQWEAELSQFNRKALTVAAAKAYFTKKNEVNAKLFAHYEQEVYRVLKWHAFVNRQRSEACMINRFQAKFGGKDDVVLAWGDWSMGSRHMRFHEPTKGVGMRRVFTRAGYEVVMVQERYTSRRCFNCKGGECVKFRSAKNPRPWMRKERPEVVVHGLLSCKNCKRLWNRDRNGSLNIMRIAQEVRAGRSRPSYLGRNFSAAYRLSQPLPAEGGVYQQAQQRGLFQIRDLRVFTFGLESLLLSTGLVHINYDAYTHTQEAGANLIVHKPGFAAADSSRSQVAMLASILVLSMRPVSGRQVSANAWASGSAKAREKPITLWAMLTPVPAAAAAAAPGCSLTSASKRRLHTRASSNSRVTLEMSAILTIMCNRLWLGLARKLARSVVCFSISVPKIRLRHKLINWVSSATQSVWSSVLSRVTMRSQWSKWRRSRVDSAPNRSTSASPSCLRCNALVSPS